MEDELLLRVRAGGSQDAVAEARDAIKRHFEEREAERRRDVILHRPACHAQSGPAALLSARRGRWPSQPGLGSASGASVDGRQCAARSNDRSEAIERSARRVADLAIALRPYYSFLRRGRRGSQSNPLVVPPDHKHVRVWVGVL